MHDPAAESLGVVQMEPTANVANVSLYSSSFGYDIVI